MRTEAAWQPVQCLRSPHREALAALTAAADVGASLTVAKHVDVAVSAGRGNAEAFESGPQRDLLLRAEVAWRPYPCSSCEDVMPMHYAVTAIPDTDIPRAAVPLLQHVLATYASETNKVASVWRCFSDAELGFRPHAKSTSVGDVFKHQLLSERRFFGEFLGAAEPAASDTLPPTITVDSCIDRFTTLARSRLIFLAPQPESWWTTVVPFFDVERERIWILWRRILHTAHHRTQLAVYLRMLDKPVPAIYGPTADVSWTGADPTTTIAAAART